jgi:hypothetical protein
MRAGVSCSASACSNTLRDSISASDSTSRPARRIAWASFSAALAAVVVGGQTGDISNRALSGPARYWSPTRPLRMA